jgi:hypothetical protein
MFLHNIGQISCGTDSSGVKSNPQMNTPHFQVSKKSHPMLVGGGVDCPYAAHLEFHSHSTGELINMRAVLVLTVSS